MGAAVVVGGNFAVDKGADFVVVAQLGVGDGDGVGVSAANYAESVGGVVLHLEAADVEGEPAEPAIEAGELGADAKREEICDGQRGLVVVNGSVHECPSAWAMTAEVSSTSELSTPGL